MQITISNRVFRLGQISFLLWAASCWHQVCRADGPGGIEEHIRNADAIVAGIPRIYSNETRKTDSSNLTIRIEVRTVLSGVVEATNVFYEVMPLVRGSPSPKNFAAFDMADLNARNFIRSYPYENNQSSCIFLMKRSARGFIPFVAYNDDIGGTRRDFLMMMIRAEQSSATQDVETVVRSFLGERSDVEAISYAVRLICHRTTSWMSRVNYLEHIRTNICTSAQSLLASVKCLSYYLWHDDFNSSDSALASGFVVKLLSSDGLSEDQRRMACYDISHSGKFFFKAHPAESMSLRKIVEKYWTVESPP